MTLDSETAERPVPASNEASAVCGWCHAPLRPARHDGFATELCGVCGARTTWPVPTDAELEFAYGSWYRPHEGRFTGLGDRALRALRGRLASRLDRIAPAGPILDVGSGDGALLDALAAVGRDAIVLERHSERPDVREAELSDLEGPFAAIVFWHSLEHLREAGSELARAVRLLAPGGLVVVAMPNPASLQARAFGERWLALDLPRHLVHVPTPALLARLRELGLEPTRISYLRGGQVVFGWLHGLVGSLPSHPDLYDAIRKPEARRAPLPPGQRALALSAAALALPVAAGCAVTEAGLRRAGTVYVEARRA
ncbi:MAG: class I SAM-dependent methyltransferase [Solirubrobacterales bacterium]